MLGDVIRDWTREIRTAVRSLARAPGFTVVGLLTLGIGLGASVTIITLVDRVVLRPLAYPDAERLVQLRNQVPGVGPDTRWGMSTAQYVQVTDEPTGLESVALYRALGANIDTPSGPQRSFGWWVTHETLGLLGGEPALGRLILTSDDRPRAPLVTVLSHGFWSRQFGSDPGAVGRSLIVNGQPVEIVGVLREGFRMPGSARSADLFMPLRIDRAGFFGNNHVFNMVGRLAEGVDPVSAEADLERLKAGLPERFPRAYSQAFFDQYGFRTEVTPLKEAVLGERTERSLWILLAAVGSVLFIACANVTNLFVVRMESRRRELGVRAALGAGRSTLARYLLAEGLTLSFGAAALALVVAYWGVPTLLAAAPGTLPRMDEVVVGGSTLGAAAALALLVGVGLVAYPLLAHVRPALMSQLTGLGQGGRRGPGRQRVRSALVVLQVALAVALAAAGGLLLESIRTLNRLEMGFEPRGVLTARVHLDASRYDSDTAVWEAYDRMMENVLGLPGVQSVGMSEALPLSNDFGCTVQAFEDEAVYERIRAAGMTTCAGQTRVAPGYFETLGIPVLGGRPLTRADNRGAGAVVVSKAFAERFWPGEDPIGKGVNPSGRTTEPFYHVVGMVGDVPEATLDGEPAMAIYYPVVHDPAHDWDWWLVTSTSLTVRTALADPVSLFDAVRHAIHEVDPKAPVVNASSMEALVADSMGRLTFVSTLLWIAGSVALLLSAVGMYGVISYTVGRRTREIGMRIALGARPAQVQRTVLRGSLRLTVLGLATGIGAALLGTRALRGLLVGVEPGDPVVLGGAAVLLTVVALLASWIPAHRAARIAPSEALRVD